ncbi:MAG: AAA family ATPase, partial [Deltaproteobacteria bacterium]|nr:AAA family ATPase [Candidatus Tharpella aukensis]
MQGINEIPDEGNRHSDQGLANKEIHLDFQTFVHNGIKKLDKGSVVASLEYKKNNKKHKIEFIFGGFNKGHGEIINPKIEIKINKNSCVVPSRAKFEKSNHSLKFRSNGINGWQMIKLKDSEVGDLENLLTIDEEEIYLPSVNKTDENFLSFWFNTPQKKLGKGSVETIERVRPIGVDTEYSSMWDCIEVNGTTVTIKDFPQLPDYNSEKTVFVNNRELDVEWARFFIVVIVWRIILSTLMVEKQDEDSDNSRKHIGSRKDCSESFAAALFNFLPPTSDYRPKRPVDINPHAVSDALMAEKLEVPWHVISSATAALNAGKHIIFTGPPGCGKTHLARLISQIGSAKSPLMSTASQAWSTDEVIGKYMPNVEGTGLEFKYGFFLRALKSHQWLVIDEINRCDIDNCFGELFTVLSGQSVSIPFEKKSDEGIFKPIRIDVGGDSE